MSQIRASTLPYTLTYPHAHTYRIRIACGAKGGVSRCLMGHIRAYACAFKYAHTYVYACGCGAEGGCAQGVVLKAWYMAGPACLRAGGAAARQLGPKRGPLCLSLSLTHTHTHSLSLSLILPLSLSLSLSHSLSLKRRQAQRDIR